MPCGELLEARDGLQALPASLQGARGASGRTLLEAVSKGAYSRAAGRV